MFFEIFVGVATALVVSFIVCGALRGAGPIDVPDAARKAHDTPTPTSGGIGIAVGFAGGLIALSVFSSVWRDHITGAGVALLSAGAAIAYGFLALGFIDDARPLSARLKFAISAALAFGAALSMGVVEELNLGWDITLQFGFWVGLAGTALWMFTLVNSVNFMDGANGLAMGSVGIGLVVLGAIAHFDEAPTGVAMTWCAVGALLGFLLWNFPFGRLFAGDSGALFSGAVAGMVALLVIKRTGLSPIVPPIVFFPLLADVLLTLASRVARGRSLLDGHSEHIYQIARRAGWSPVSVTFSYWAAMAVCGAVAFWASRAPETGAPLIALAVLAIVAIVISVLVRRYARKRGIEEI